MIQPYTFVTKEEVENYESNCSQYGCGAFEILDRLLAERDAYRHVAAKQMLDTADRPGDNEKVKEVNKNFGEWMLHRVDSEARKLLEKGE
jgi:hypothetical protein